VFLRQLGVQPPTTDLGRLRPRARAGLSVRIVSLLPSATEIVCELGLGDALVGVTHECDHPPFVKALPKVTRTLVPHDAPSGEIDALVREKLKGARALYSLDLETLERLRPELIVTQALCDVCAVAEEEVTSAACSLPGAPRVVNLEPMRLSEVFDCLRLVGDAAGVPERAAETVARLEARVAAVERRTRGIAARPRVALLEWIDPPVRLRSLVAGDRPPRRRRRGRRPRGRAVAHDSLVAVRRRGARRAGRGLLRLRQGPHAPGPAAARGLSRLPRAARGARRPRLPRRRQRLLQPARAAARRQPRDPRARAAPGRPPAPAGHGGAERVDVEVADRRRARRVSPITK
jgi:hypothetical protein